MRRAISSQRGSFLLEALVGVAIFSIAILGLIGLQTVAVNRTNDSQNRLIAVQLAESYVAQLRIAHAMNGSAAWYQAFQTGGGSYSTWATLVASQIPGSSGAFAPTVTFGGTVLPGTNQVTITVMWPGGSAVSSTATGHQLVLNTQV